jgi:hypothetical protein
MSKDIVRMYFNAPVYDSTKHFVHRVQYCIFGLFHMYCEQRHDSYICDSDQIAVSYTENTTSLRSRRMYVCRSFGEFTPLNNISYLFSVRAPQLRNLHPRVEAILIVYSCLFRIDQLSFRVF